MYREDDMLPATTVDLNVSFLRSASVGDRLSARAELLHLGRRTASLAFRVTDQRERLIAHGITTWLLLAENPATGGNVVKCN
jgi:acyl-CoA thioesterase